MKVLLFSNDLMPFGSLPTSGGGLRCWQLKKGLESRGIEVVTSMPGFTFLAEKNFEKIPEPEKSLLWEFGTQDQILHQVKPDAVLFASNWDHFNLKSKLSIPLIIDLHGSRLVETTMWDQPVSTEKKVQILSRADCLLCAGKRQRLYFYGWLLQSGRVPEEEHFIRYIPISLSPDLPKHEVSENSPRFVSGGGWFPWQNQSKTILSLCRELERRKKGIISIYGSPHERLGNTPEEIRIFEIFNQVQAIAEKSTQVQLEDFIGREALIDIYRRADVAVEAMEYNLERELAFTTRTVEYLWCGLPVIYNNYAELSGHIAEYDAGWTIDPEDTEQIRETISEIYDSPECVREKGRNAARLVQERFTWDRTIEPLVEFLESPSKAKEAVPVLGAVFSRPSFLSMRGEVVDVELSFQKPLRQKFVLPADLLSSVELPYSLSASDVSDTVQMLKAELYRSNGKAVGEQTISGKDLLADGRMTIPLPRFFPPKGGVEMELMITLVGVEGVCGGSAPVRVRALVEAHYPVFVQSEALSGMTLTGEAQSAEALAVGFVPGDMTAFHQAKMLLRRAWFMICRGQWRRFFVALRKRLPQLLGRIRHVVLQGVSS